jgi:hypothetical protein
MPDDPAAPRKPTAAEAQMRRVVEKLAAAEARGEVVERVAARQAPLPGWGLPVAARPDAPPQPIAVVRADGRLWRVYALTPTLYQTLDVPRAYLDPYQGACRVLATVLATCIPERPIPPHGIGRAEIQILDLIVARWPSEPTRWEHLKAHVWECVNVAAPRLGLYDDLSDAQQDILAGAVKIKAHGGRWRPLPDILRAGGVYANEDSDSVQRAVAGLKDRGLIATKRGPGGGHTLTARGYALAKAAGN